MFSGQLNCDIHFQGIGLPKQRGKNGFLKGFLPQVSNLPSQMGSNMLIKVVDALYADDIDTALTETKAYIAAILETTNTIPRNPAP